MPSKRLSAFVFQSVIAGLVAAAAILVLWPEIGGIRPAVIEVHDGTALRPTPVSLGRGWNGPLSYADAVDRAAPAVVNIYTRKIITERNNPLFADPMFQYFFGDRFSRQKKHLQTSLGSGVIVSSQGYVLTNNHVVDGADEIQVMLKDGRTAAAHIVGVDPDTDLAVLYIHLPRLPSIVIGDSRALRVGDVVLAIGNPFGVGQTVTQGIVSATGRSHLGINTFENFIQTDAAINPGNSGGALINARGELVGINTAIYSRSGGSQGIGFAIPESLARGVMKQIIEQGRVVRGWLGIEAQDVTPAMARALGLADGRGIVIAGVLKDGPADRAGLKPGDLVTHIDGVTIPNATDALTRIAARAPGTRIHLRGLRDGRPFEADATIGRRPATRAAR